MPVYELEGHRVELPEKGKYWLADNAVLLGKVHLGFMASVWFSAVLRGDNELISIGDNTNIQDACVLHTDMGFPLTVGDDCTIGHMAMIHGCTIGRNSLIGIGATVLNGTRIGENCLIGAHALLPEGRLIPDNSLVMGTPGKVVRTLGEDEVAGLKGVSQHYVRQWQRYVSGLVLQGEE